jgi:Calcineurin-like phosphoesterase
MAAGDRGLIANVLNRDFVMAHLDAVERHLEAAARPTLRQRLLRDIDLRIEPEEAATALRAVQLTRELDDTTLRNPLLQEPSDEERAALNQHAFISRSPVVSIVQSALEERIEETLGDRIRERTKVDADAPPVAATRVLLRPDGSEPDDEQMGDPFTTTDPGWEIHIAEALVERLVRGGRHPFNSSPPPPAELASDARLVLLSDWATGLTRAEEVATYAADWIGEALAANRQVHALHLGDVYYAGAKSEYDKRMLGLWPVKADMADQVGSWCLNGNHDMYSGGWDFFDHMLADDRFARQRSPDGKGTSFFDLVGDEWHVLGLDSAWQDHLPWHWDWGDLADPQADHVAAAAQDGRKLLLLSHHQLFSAYDHHVGPLLEQKLQRTLATGRVIGWFWGHEHRCMTFDPHEQVPFARCIGHAGVPEIAHAQSAPVPSPGKWEYRGQFSSHGLSWARFGFAVLDFDGPAIHVSYVDECGSVATTEDIA